MLTPPTLQQPYLQRRHSFRRRAACTLGETDVRLMSNSAVQILVLLGVSFVLLAALGAGERGLCFQSPASPIQPPAPGGWSIAPGASAPSARSAARSSPWLRGSFWTSPLPWVAVGVVLFASISWALVTLISWLEPPQRADGSGEATQAPRPPQGGSARDDGPPSSA